MNTIARGTNRIALSEPTRNPISAWTMTAVSLLGLILADVLLPSAQAADLVTVRPQEIDDMLVNPGIGFITFQRYRKFPLALRLKSGPRNHYSPTVPALLAGTCLLLG